MVGGFLAAGEASVAAAAPAAAAGGGLAAIAGPLGIAAAALGALGPLLGAANQPDGPVSQLLGGANVSNNRVFVVGRNPTVTTSQSAGTPSDNPSNLIPVSSPATAAAGLNEMAPVLVVMGAVVVAVVLFAKKGGRK